MPSQSHSQRRCASGSRRKSPASMTGDLGRQRVVAAAPAAAARCRRARTTPATARRTRPPRPGRGSAARCGSRATQSRSMSRGEVVGHVLGVVHAARRRRLVSSRRPPSSRSVGCEAITSSRPGWSMPGAARGRPRRTARRRRPCPAGSPTRASSRSRCCAGRDHIATRTRSWPPSPGDVGGDELAVELPAAARPPARARPVPIVRPSTVRTGTTPANVPGHERLGGAVDVGQAERRLPRGDAVGAADLEHVARG